jgi:outer membrane murein-binding lipoprotein Lpp
VLDMRHVTGANVVVLLAAALLGGCGHSKTEVDGLVAELKDVKAENARLRKDVASATRNGMRCMQASVEQHHNAVEDLYRTNKDVRNRLFCWIELSFEQQAQLSMSERRARFSACIKRQLGRR